MTEEELRLEKLHQESMGKAQQEYPNDVEQGCLDIWVDDIVPCLRDTATGELKNTVVFRVESRSYLRKFNEKNGWVINWAEVPSNVEVYALALQDNNEIQGLVGVKNDVDANAVYIHWAVAAPQNNKHDFGTRKYAGVGGHLFAIAVDKSFQWGHDGVVHGFARNAELVKHYVNTFGAFHLGRQHIYQIAIFEEEARRILEVYTYEWQGKSNDT